MKKIFIFSILLLSLASCKQPYYHQNYDELVEDTVYKFNESTNEIDTIMNSNYAGLAKNMYNGTSGELIINMHKANNNHYVWVIVAINRVQYPLESLCLKDYDGKDYSFKINGNIIESTEGNSYDSGIDNYKKIINVFNSEKLELTARLKDGREYKAIYKK